MLEDFFGIVKRREVVESQFEDCDSDCSRDREPSCGLDRTADLVKSTYGSRGAMLST